MRIAEVSINHAPVGQLEELLGGAYRFTYDPLYRGAPISLTMPLQALPYQYAEFPPFFEGLLPEGQLLEGLLRQYKLDRNDYFGQLLVVGQDVVGAVTLRELK